MGDLKTGVLLETPSESPRQHCVEVGTATAACEGSGVPTSDTQLVGQFDLDTVQLTLSLLAASEILA